MKARQLLESAIARQTDLDAHNIAEEVFCNFFDDKWDIIGDILKNESDEAQIGRLLKNSLKETIKEAVYEAERDSGNLARSLKINGIIDRRNERDAA